MARLSIVNKTKGKLPRLPFTELAKRVLGTNYELSLAFVSAKESQRLNRSLRGKNKPANVLSFSMAKTSGEILIAPAVAKREASRYGHTPRIHLAHLFIHGLLHLKGLAHGARMEDEERRLLRISF